MLFKELGLLVSKLEDLFRRRSASFVLYLALVFASFYPQSLRPHDTFGYVGDSLYHIYQIGWTNQQLINDPLHWYDANVLYPNRRTFTFADHQLLPSLILGPIFWATGNPVLAYNVGVAIGCLLAAFGLRHLALKLGVDPVGAWAAGALYAFHTYQINEAPRLIILYHGFIPLALAQLIDYLNEGETKRVLWLAGLMYLQALSASYHLAYGSLLVGIVTLGFLVAKPVATLKKLPALALAAGGAGALYLPILWPYIQNSADYGYARELPTGIDLVHYFSTSPTNVWYGAIGTEVRVQQMAAHFIGFVTIGCVLVVLGAWALRRLPRRDQALLRPSVWVPCSASLALLFVSLSFGKDMIAFGRTLGPGTYRILFHFVPGFQVLRIPERLSLIAMLFLALLAGMSLTLFRRWGYRLPALGLALLLPLEHLSPLALTDRVPVVADVPAVYEWLREDSAKAVAEVPIHGEALLRKETLEMYFSTRHLKPIIHGYTAYPPLLTMVMRRFAEQFPDDASLEGFSRVGVDTVVVHHGRPHGEATYRKLPERVAAGYLQRAARFSGDAARIYDGTYDEVYRIVDAPSLEVAPLPKGRRLVDPTWSLRTKRGDPAPAVDGDLSTSWRVRGRLAGDEFFEMTFERVERVSGLQFRLRHDSIFPTIFKIAGRQPDGIWIPLAFYDAAHQLQLLETLLEDPRDPVLGFDWADRELSGVRIMIEDGGHSALGWSIPEIEVVLAEP